MKIETIPNGMLDTNSYLIISGTECAIIDAGVPSEVMKNLLSKKEFSVKYIILTHGHYDHIYYADETRKITGAKLAIHNDDKEFLQNTFYNASSFFEPRTISTPEIVLEDDQLLPLGDSTIKIIHTPGHTPGGICILADQNLFTGDTLFRGSIGRTDLPGGDYQEIIESIHEKLFTLNDSIIVYPGHGNSSTIGHEKKTNPFFK